MTTKLVVFVVAFALPVAIALATPEERSNVSPAASRSIPYTPQEQYLARSNGGNFACRVGALKISVDSPGQDDATVVTADSLRDALANVATLEWAHIPQTSFSAIDGRNDEKVLSAPGGDMGEFIHAIAAFEKTANRVLTADEVQETLERYLKIMSRSKFSYETDEKAYLRLAIATGCRNLHVTEMGGMKRKRETYLANVAFPEHIGDPFIRFLSGEQDGLLGDGELVGKALGAYHKVLWTTPSRLSSKLCYLQMKGATRQEKALVTVKTEGYCVDQGLAPMISQQMAVAAPVMTNFPDAVRVLRRELVSVMTEGEDGVDPVKMMATYNSMAESNFEKFWSEYGAGLPQYTVQFQSTSPLLTSDRSFQP